MQREVDRPVEEVQAVVSKKDAEAKSSRLIRKICISSFFSVMQHFIFAQSEPRLFLSLCDKDSARATRLLGNTSGIVGILSLVLNQAGGKLSDSIGRRPGFIIGPLINVFLGLIVFKSPRNLTSVTICRVLRYLFTTFSNTVMCTAALADVCSKSELALAMSKIQVATGIAMLGTPFVEGKILSSNPFSPDAIKYVYLVMSGVAACHLAFVTTQIEETLDVAKRTAGTLNLQAINPFGFVRIFTEGSVALRKVVAITTLQMFLEGKNVADIVMTWVRDKLGWSVEGIRNFITAYGALCLLTGMTATPYMLKNMSARGFTTSTNLLNTIAFSTRAAVPSTALWIAMMFPMLPGVNGSSATALKAVAQELANKQGFGKGEFSGWVNNLRALAGSVSPVVYAQCYAAAEKRGANPGHTFALAGVFGAILPQLLLRTMKDSELAVDK